MDHTCLLGLQWDPVLAPPKELPTTGTPGRSPVGATRSGGRVQSGAAPCDLGQGTEDHRE